MNTQEITRRLQNALPILRQTYGVRDLWLFGSYVKAKQTSNSDIDILVTFDNPRLSLVEFIQLEQELAVLLDRKVDLVERNMLKPTISQYVLQEAVMV